MTILLIKNLLVFTFQHVVNNLKGKWVLSFRHFTFHATKHTASHYQTYLNRIDTKGKWHDSFNGWFESKRPWCISCFEKSSFPSTILPEGCLKLYSSKRCNIIMSEQVLRKLTINVLLFRLIRDEHELTEKELLNLLIS